MILIEWDDPIFIDMTEFYTLHEPDIFFKTHYELADMMNSPSEDPQMWKKFVTHPQVSDYIKQEVTLLQQAEMRKIMHNISDKANSPGTAQMISALQKSMEGLNVKDGPAYIYTYIPLTRDELKAYNVEVLKYDPFIKKER